MSRPFSYNDQNYTVIGNMLFIHYHYNGSFFDGLVFNVPWEIRKRVYHYENYLLMTNMNYLNDNAIVPVTMKPGYLTARENVDIPELNNGERWYYGMYLLKDI
jgi:hypothetical protein